MWELSGSFSFHLFKTVLIGAPATEFGSLHRTFLFSVCRNLAGNIDHLPLQVPKEYGTRNGTWEINRPASKVSSSQVIAQCSVKGCRYGCDDSEVRERTSETVYLVARHLVVMDQHRRICELPERLDRDDLVSVCGNFCAPIGAGLDLDAHASVVVEQEGLGIL